MPAATVRWVVGVIGRSDEVAWLTRVVDPDGPAVATVFGLAGVGKSFLLDHLGDLAERSGWACSGCSAHRRRVMCRWVRRRTS